MNVTAGSISAYPDDIIQTKALIIPNTTNKLITSVNIDDESLSFATNWKKTIVTLNQEITIIFITKFH